jgi:hypothetical protein
MPATITKAVNANDQHNGTAFVNPGVQKGSRMLSRNLGSGKYVISTTGIDIRYNIRWDDVTFYTA